MGEYTAPHVERPTVINPLRRRNRDRGLTPEQRDEVQKLVFELVQTRLIHAFGPRGLFTVTPHDPTAVDTFFAQAVADTIAWDVAAKLASPGAVSAPIEQVSAALTAAVAAAPLPVVTAPAFVSAPAPVTAPAPDTASAPVAVRVERAPLEAASTASASSEVATTVATSIEVTSHEAETTVAEHELVSAAPETAASVSVDTAGVAVVTDRFAPSAERSVASQVAEARANRTTTSADQQPESARRQLVA